MANGNVPEIEVRPGVHYLHHPHHRNKNPNKSQWTIDPPTERHCFLTAYDSHWVEEFKAWSFLMQNGNSEPVGISADGRFRLKIAKFRDDNQNAHWHGYPADHRNTQDHPPEFIWQEWMNQNTIERSTMRRLMKALPC